MIVLGIDTATELVSVALVEGEQVLAASESLSERRHAEDLTPMLQFVVQRAGLQFSQIDAVAVDVGPGLFTGMRVGIAAAQALAQVLSLPLVGVDSLEALVTGTVQKGDHDLIVPVIDTRRREIAWSLHRINDDGSARRVSSPQVGSLQDLIAAVRERSQSCLFVGGFALSNREQIQADLGPEAWMATFDTSSPVHPHARHIAALGYAQLLRGREDSSDRKADVDGLVTESRATEFAPTVQPMYLREADAEINWTTRGTK
jgi:tRNA threonylcarbamoyladenosine biosynthesis protein TsaB